MNLTERNRKAVQFRSVIPSLGGCEGKCYAISAMPVTSTAVKIGTALSGRTACIVKSVSRMSSPDGSNAAGSKMTFGIVIFSEYLTGGAVAGMFS